MNHRLTRYALFAALLSSVAVPLRPVVEAAKRGKANNRRNKPSAGRRSTPLANALRHMPRDLSIEHGRARQTLSKLAGRYDKVPVLGKLSPERRIGELFRQVTSNATLAAQILEQYAQTLRGQAAFVDLTIVAGDHGGELKLEGMAGEIVTRPALEVAAHHLRQQALRERKRAKVADMTAQRFGFLDEEVPQLGRDARCIRKRVAAVNTAGRVDTEQAVDLVADATRLIAAGADLLSRIPCEVLLKQDSVDDEPTCAVGNDLEFDPSEVARTGATPGQEDYRRLFEQVFEVRALRVTKILHDLRLWRRQLRQWAGLPDGQFVLSGDPPPMGQRHGPRLNEQLESVQREQVLTPAKHNRGRYQNQGPVLFAQRLLSDALVRVEDADPQAAGIMRQRAAEGPYRHRAAQLGLGEQEIIHPPNKSPVYRINIEGYTEAHELLAERAMMLLNSLAHGDVRQKNLWWGFSVSNASTETDRGGFFSKTIRVWDGRRLLIDQVSAQGQRFWEHFFVDPPVGPQARILAEPALRAVVELLVERHLRAKLEGDQRERIGSEYRRWVDRRGIPLEQILGLTSSVSDPRERADMRLRKEGPYFASETDLVLQGLMRSPSPAFEPFVPHLEGRHPHMLWDPETLDITLKYTKP